MRKKHIKYIALGSIVGISSIALYKYKKAKQVEKNTKDYILNEKNDMSEVPKRKYISLTRKGY